MSERSPGEIREHLLAARERLLALTRDLEPAQFTGPRLDIVEPTLWTLGHIAWYQERWCLRITGEREVADSMVNGADALYDDARSNQDTRWTLPMLSLAAVRGYLDNVLERTLDQLEKAGDKRVVRVCAELAAQHEDGHLEAIHRARQTLAFPPPTLPHRASEASPSAMDEGDAECAGGAFMLGAYPEYGFVFDNEKWAHEVRVAPFGIARTPVSNAQYRQFIEAGGYRHRAFWSPAGWAWLRTSHSIAPRYWRRFDGIWMERRFDRLVPLAAHTPVTHVNLYEAEAYCAWAGRRLPTEAEWEYAASASRGGIEKPMFPWGGGEAATPTRANVESNEVALVTAFAAGDSVVGCRQMIGNVWEWTASVFERYPGFTPDVDPSVSEPHFGSHHVLRGGSFATPMRAVRNSLRGFGRAHRGDYFAGFRTCRLES